MKHGNFLTALLLSSFILQISLMAQDKKKDDDKETALTRRLKVAYKHIYEQVPKDIKFNTYMLEKYKKDLARIPTKGRTKSKTEEYKRLRERYENLVALYTKLLAQDEIIMTMFTTASDNLRIMAAMEMIPRLEKEIKDETGGKKLRHEREWLTLEEVQLRLKSGLKYRTKDPTILPHHVDNWYKPDEDEDEEKKKKKRRENTEETKENE